MLWIIEPTALIPIIQNKFQYQFIYTVNPNAYYRQLR